MGVDSDLIRGHVDTIILNILATSDKDKYGYEIIKDVEDKSNGSYELKQPTLYSCLKRMESNDLITSYWEDSDIGGRRKYYRITDKGRETFENNLKEWVQSRSIIDHLINVESISSTDKTQKLETVDNLDSTESMIDDEEDSSEEAITNEKENLIEEVTQEEVSIDINLITEEENLQSEEIITDINDDLIAEIEFDNEEVATEDEAAEDETAEDEAAEDEATEDETAEDEATEDNIEVEDIIHHNEDDYEQTTLFDIDQANTDNLEEETNSITELIVKDSALSDEFEKQLEPEDNVREHEELHKFDLKNQFSNQNKSFFEANKSGEAVYNNLFDFEKRPINNISSNDIFNLNHSKDGIDNISEEINFENEVNFVENTESSSEDNEFLEETPQIINSSENSEASTPTDNFTESDDEDKDYFKIKFDDDEDENEKDIDIIKTETQTDITETLNVSIIPSSTDENKTISDNLDNKIFIDEQSKKTTGITSVTFEDVLHETHSSIEKENASLFEKLENIKTYTPRYTDNEYKNILGGLTTYSTQKKQPLQKEQIDNETIKSGKIASDFNATKEKLNKEGFIVKLHTKRERESAITRTFLLVNKIKLANSWIVYFAMLTLLTCTYFIADRLNYLDQAFTKSTLYFIVAAALLLIIPITASLQYFSNPMKKIIPRYAPRASFLFALLFFIQCLVLVYAINLPFGFYSFYQTDYNHLNWLIPSVCSLVFLLNSAFYSLLFKSRNFHV